MKSAHKIKLAALSASILALTSVPAIAEDFGVDVSANVGLVSQYSFRGIAQSNENIAVQGGFDLSHDSGIYLGVWGSNVDFNDGDEANVEIDFYGGYGGIYQNINYDIGFIYYAYPGANSSLNYDFWEASLALGYDFDLFSASASINHSPEFFADSGDAQYYTLGVDVPLPAEFSLSAHLGHQDIDDNAAFGVPDYTDWSLALNYNFEGFDTQIKYLDTDLEEPGECADGCDARVIFGISRSF